MPGAAAGLDSSGGRSGSVASAQGSVSSGSSSAASPAGPAVVTRPRADTAQRVQAAHTAVSSALKLARGGAFSKDAVARRDQEEAGIVTSAAAAAAAMEAMKAKTQAPEKDAIPPLWTVSRESRPEFKALLAEVRGVLELKRQSLPDEDMRKFLQGDVDTPIPETRNCIKLFTSSTFTDTTWERNMLMADVYPYLRDLCRLLSMDFHVVDMRWGVREDTTDDHGTSALCMHEVEECKRTSAGPAFVTFLGNKYGFRPFPPKIEKGEFETILAAAKAKPELSTELIEKWFELDTNAVPPCYILHPISKLIPEFKSEDDDERAEGRSRWWDDFEEMQKVLRAGAAALKSDVARHKYSMSVTEEEIEYGIINNPRRDEQAVVFRRAISGIGHLDTDAPKFVDIAFDEDGRPGFDKEAADLLEKLKTVKLPAVLKPASIHDLAIEWAELKRGGIDMVSTEGQQGQLLRQFCDEFCRTIGRGILTSFTKQRTLDDPDVAEILLHRKFAEVKTAQCMPRPDLMGKIDRYLADPDATSPFVLHGPSGTGKTSIMAMSAFKAKRANPGAVLVLRFIGTTPNSTDGRALLHSVCTQLSKAYGKADRDGPVPEDYPRLIAFFQACLARATAAKPAIVFLDSLDQMSEEYRARDMRWMPKVLPRHAHVVVSTITNIGGSLEALRTVFRNDAKAIFAEINALDARIAEEILDNLLSSSQRALTPKQKSLVMESFKSTPLPLFLRLTTDNALRWHSFTTDPNLYPSMLAIIRALFERLERVHGRHLVESCFAHISASKSGLSAMEIEDLLSCDDTVLNDVYEWWTPPVRRLPPSLWVRIRADLGAYLVTRGADGTTVFSWYHRQFVQAAEERYLSVEARRLEVHSSLMDYFSGRWCGAPKPYEDPGTGRKMYADRKVAAQPLIYPGGSSNQRKLSELPYHQVLSGNIAATLTSLCSFEFIRIKCTAGKFHELLQDYVTATSKLQAKAAAVAATSAAAAKGKTKDFLASTTGSNAGLNIAVALLKVESYFRFVKASGAILSEALPVVLQLALAQPKHSPVHADAVAYIRRSKAELTITGEASGEPLVFFDWLNKPSHENVCLLTLIDHKGKINSVSHAGALLASSSADRLVKTFDAETGAEIATFAHLPTSEAVSVNLSADGSSVMIAWDDGLVEYKNTGSSPEVKSQTYKGGIKCARLSPNGKVVASAVKNTICIWHLVAGSASENHQFPVCHADDVLVTTLAFSPKSEYVVCGSWDRAIRVFTVDTGWLEHDLGLMEGSRVNSVAVSLHSRVVAASDRQVLLWDSFKDQTPRSIHVAVATEVIFSPDGLRVVCACFNNTVQVASVATGARLLALRGHSGPVTAVSMSEDGTKIFSGSEDCTIKVWHHDINAVATLGSNIESHAEAAMLSASTGSSSHDLAGKGLPFDLKHDDRISAVAFSSDATAAAAGQDILVSASDDGLVLAVNAQTLEKVGSKKHLKGISALQFKPDASQFITLSVDKAFCQAVIYDRRSFNIDARLECQPTESLVVLQYSPDGQVIATGAKSCQIVIWGAAKGESRRIITAPYGAITSLAFTSDSKLLASGSDDKVPRVFNVASGEMVAVWKELPATVTHVVWVTDGKILVAVTSDSTVYALDVANKSILKSNKTGQLSITCVSLTLAAKALLCGGQDGTIKLWDSHKLALDASPIGVYSGHSNAVTSLVVGAEAPKYFRGFSGSKDGTVQLWACSLKGGSQCSMRVLGTFHLRTPVTCVAAAPAFNRFGVGDNQGGVFVLTFWSPALEERAAVVSAASAVTAAGATTSGASIHASYPAAGSPASDLERDGESSPSLSQTLPSRSKQDLGGAEIEVSLSLSKRTTRRALGDTLVATPDGAMKKTSSRKLVPIEK